jgi:hypothetical protein
MLRFQIVKGHMMGSSAMLAPGGEFALHRIGNPHNVARCPLSRRPLWTNRNLVGKLSQQVFSSRHGDRRYQHVSLAAARDLDL